jgi:DNA mismatch repair protein MutL
MQVYQENRAYFEQLGFETEAFGGKEIAIRALPLVLGETALESLFRDALDSIADNKAASAPELIKGRIITSACKHSIKAGDVMSAEELNDLIQKLGQNESLTCPHGRPVAIRIERKDLEKGFKRLV